MIALDFTRHRNQPVQLHSNQLEIAHQRHPFSESFDFGPPFGRVPVEALARVAEHTARLTGNTGQPQLAGLVFSATGHPRALDWYFPITQLLTGDALSGFDRLREDIAGHPAFDLRLVGDSRADLTALMPAESRGLVAGHLAETFYHRRDLLERFLSSPRHFLLYATPAAFKDDGGEAGGCFHADRECVQLVVSRLFEGYGGQTPGVAPFLHEFGHMLDFFDAGAGRMSKNSSGFLPGLRPGDGPLYRPRARELFVKGKRIERDRYLARYIGLVNPGDPLPIGHPYVFQNDTEFIAGYFEMFFRNPNYFGASNPDLFNAFVDVFGYDTRRAWPRDFPFYVEGNRQFYRSGERPWEPGITVPAG
jgi:hypothetical protein